MYEIKARRRYQSAYALTADGYPTPALAQHVRDNHVAAALKGKLKPAEATPKFADTEP